MYRLKQQFYDIFPASDRNALSIERGEIRIGWKKAREYTLKDDDSLPLFAVAADSFLVPLFFTSIPSNSSAG